MATRPQQPFYAHRPVPMVMVSGMTACRDTHI